MYRFLVARLAVAIASGDFWPHYAGRREVTSLDGEWLFGFNASKDFDVLQEMELEIAVLIRYEKI